MDDHKNCLQVPEFERYTKQQADYQKAQNGSIQHIEGKTDQIFDKLDVISTTQNDLYKTIQEINVSTVETVQRVADKRSEDFKEYELQRAGDVTAENKRFAGIEKTIGKIEQRQVWSTYLKRIPGKVWIVIVSVAGLTATILGILAICHVL